MIPREYLTVAESAEFCGVSVSQFRAKAPAAGLRPFPFMGKLLYRVADLDGGLPPELQGAAHAAYTKLRKADLERKRRQESPGQFIAKRAARRAAQMKRTPPWADAAAIKAVYDEAARVAKATGAPMHVDHIIPLRGRTVSGLHVHYNLQILPGLENLSKGNRLVCS